MIQTVSAILFFYVFGLAAIIMTYLVVRAILDYRRAQERARKQTEEEQEHAP